MDIVTSQKLRQALPLFTALAVCILILSIGTILYLGREIFVPFALAILLSFALSPVVNALQWARVPQTLAIFGAAMTAVVAIGLIGLVIVSQLSSLAAELPTYRATMQAKIEGITSSTGSNTGPIGGLVVMLQEMSRDLSNIGESKDQAIERAAGDRPVVVTVDEGGSTLGTVTGVLSPLLHPLATIGLVFIFAIFILAQREDLRNRFIRMAGTEDLQQTTAAIDDAGRRLGRLLLTQLAVNTCFGVVIGTGLFLIGVPSPFLWGIIAGILRFVPYVGAVVGAALPLALAFAVDPGWTMAIWTVVLFLAVEPILGHVIEPLLYGHSSGLSPITVILAAALWALIWGPVGLVLATPLTICLVVMGRYVKRLAFIDIMLGDRPALLPPQIFYQRMLGGAIRDANRQAFQFLRQRALSTYYDEVALEGLRLAHEDVARFAVEGPRLDLLRRSTLTHVSALDALESPLPAGGSLRPEAAAAVDAAGLDATVSRIVRGRGELGAEWQGQTPVVCIAGRNPLDLPVAAMLGQTLTKHGLRTQVVPMEEVEGRSLTAQDAQGVALVCLSFVEPLSTLHLRHMVRRVHRVAPRAKVLVCIWRQRDPQMVAELTRRVRADGIATTITGALATIFEMSAGKPAAAPAQTKTPPAAKRAA